MVLAEDDDYRPLGSPLYHYTSVDALQKIYVSRKLHATHAAYLNDGSEIGLGLQILIGEIEAAAAEMAGRQRDLLAWLHQRVQLEMLGFPPVFMLCFSERRNTLSQWRSYTPLGNGVCIGFNHQLLIERATRAQWEWFSCSYTEANHRKWMRAYLGRFSNVCKETDQGLKLEDFAIGVWEKCLRTLYVCAAHVKHSAFAEEREWRLVSPPTMTQDKSVKFRAGRHSLVPYIEFELTDEKQVDLPLREIVIGPTPRPEAARHAVMSMQLSIRHSDHARVEDCGIPFRDI